jgi:ribonuclease J
MPPNPKALVPKSRAKKLEPQPLEPASNTIKGLRFQAMPVDHSIPGAVGFTFEAEEGIIVYSRDIRLHGTQGEQTRRFEEIVAQQKPYLLIIEGTRLGRETITNVTEQQVLESALAIVRASGGKLVIADFGPRHIERLATFLAIARETNRLLVITTKDGYLLEAIAAADAHLNLLDDPALGILDELRLASLGWEEDFRQRHQHRLIRPEDVHSDHSRYLLALSFYDMNDLLDIHPHGSVYIYSSSEAYGEDQRVDAWRLWNWLRFYQMEVHGLRWVGNDEHGHPAFPGQLHASGHITADDLLWLIQEIQPRYVLPVHTQHPEWFVQQLSGEPIQVVPTTNGQWFQTPV